MYLHNMRVKLGTWLFQYKFFYKLLRFQSVYGNHRHVCVSTDFEVVFPGNLEHLNAMGTFSVIQKTVILNHYFIQYLGDSFRSFQYNLLEARNNSIGGWPPQASTPQVVLVLAIWTGELKWCRGKCPRFELGFFARFPVSLPASLLNIGWS